MSTEQGSAESSPEGGGDRRRDVAKIFKDLGDAGVAIATVAYYGGATAPAVMAGAVGAVCYAGSVVIQLIRPRS
jgi:hypothetical protein